MIRKHLAVASALVLLMAVVAQAAERIHVTNDDGYKLLQDMNGKFDGVLKGTTLNIPLSVYTTGGTATTTVSRNCQHCWYCRHPRYCSWNSECFGLT